MRILKVDDNGLMAVENGKAVFLYDQDAVLQLVKQRLRFIKGENYLNTLKGVPYFESVFMKSTSVEDAIIILRKVVANTPGVSAILKFEATYNGNTRILTIDFKARTESGTIIYKGEV